uniref:Uncharacterized protein n=1 Tax=Lepeophtheirus salmonis TaxID=72036 RepID=A0A0K2UN30_LEPSM
MYKIHRLQLSLGVLTRWRTCSYYKETVSVNPGQHVPLGKGLLATADPRSQPPRLFHLGARGGQGLQHPPRPKDLRRQGMGLNEC